MPVVGLLLSLVIGYIIALINQKNTSKKKEIILNIIMIAIAVIYMICSLTLNIEPFDFEVTEPTDYIINSVCIFVFSPFLWILSGYYIIKVYKLARVNKNKKIKSSSDYIYYRDDLNKISPSILMFTSTFDVDFTKSLSVEILKLKADGYVEEINGKLAKTTKDTSNLLETEKMVLDYVTMNTLDEKVYKQAIEKQAIANKYVKKNNNNVAIKLLKMLLAILIPVILTIASIGLDDYVFENYHIYKENDGYTYIHLQKDSDIERAYEHEVKDINDYYSREVLGEPSYNYGYIRADRSYGIVLYTKLLNVLVPFAFLITAIAWFGCPVVLVEQIKYFNKNYKRTFAGNDLLTKAYALKDYLKEYSLMKDRTEKELVLWNYYLIYAVALDINEKIEDEVINKYCKFLS